MGVEDELRAAVRRAMDDADERGRLDTVEGRKALRRTVDLMLQLARHLLEAGEHGAAREEAQGALDLLEPLNGFAVAMPGLPGLRLDAHQILGSVLLEAGEREAAIEELRRAASHVYGAQPDERSITVACPPLERQLTQLWRELLPSAAAHRVRASLRAVRTMLGYLEEALAVASESLRAAPSAHEVSVDGPFFRAASRLVERPLAHGADAAASLERATAAVASEPQDPEASAYATLELAEALHRVGRRTDAVATVEPLLDVAPDLPRAAAIELCLRASALALHGLRTDVGIGFGRIALDVALRPEPDGAATDAALEGVARFTLGRALSESDDDEAAVVECELAHRMLSAVADDAPTPLRVAAGYAAAYVSFLRDHIHDREGALEALAYAQSIAMRLSDERPDEPRVRAMVREVLMSTARRHRDEPTAVFAATVDQLEVLLARDPDDLSVATDLFNALRFFAVTLDEERHDEAVASQRRSVELLDRIRDADPDGLNVVFHRAELAQEEAFRAHLDGRSTAFRWRAQDSMKLHAAEIAIDPRLPMSSARAASAAMQLAHVAAAMRDRKLATRLTTDGLRSARRQVELQPEVRTAHENLITSIRQAMRAASATGDARRERELAAEVLEATRALVAIDPEDPELQYALVDALTDAVAIIGQQRMKGVDHLFAELEELVAGIADVDPLHPRLHRILFSVAEASTLRAQEEDRPDDAFRHAVRALRNAYGGIHIRHHHGGKDHSGPEDRHRIAVLAMMLTEAAEKATSISGEEQDEASGLLVRLHRSGFGPDPQVQRTPGEALSEVPEPDDDIPEVFASQREAHGAVGDVRVGGGPDGTFIKPSNGGHPGLYFGVGLSATEELIVVGAPGDPSAEHHEPVDGDASDRSGSGRGAAHVYRRTADGWHHEAYLKPPLPVNGLKFGWSIAVDGPCVAIGSPLATYPVEGQVLLPGETPPRAGGVWIFTHDGSGWGLDQLLAVDEEPLIDGLGSKVVLQGDTLLASGSDVETGRGVVVEFRRQDGEWSQRSVIRSPRPEYGARDGVRFGQSMALDGDVLVVGEPSFFGQTRHRDEDPDKDLLPGAAWVFRRDDRAGWRTEALLLGPSPRFGATHGGAVAVRGDLIAVTSALHPNREDDEEPGRARSGAVTLYGRSATGWEALATLGPPHPHSQEFGGSVTISDDRRVLVGSALDAHGSDWDGPPDVLGPEGPRYGAVHVIEETPDGWAFSGVVVAGVPGEGDEFGSRIALSGSDLVVAAPNDSTSGSGVGAVLHDDDARDSGAVHVIPGLLG